MEKSRACMYLQQVIRTMDNACEDVSADMDRIREDRDELLRQITDQKFFEDACKVVQKHTDRIFEILSELNTSSSKRQARLAIDLHTEKLYGSGSESEQYLFLSEYQHQLFQYDF